MPPGGQAGQVETRTDDADLRAWAQHRDEAAFARLVERHTSLVGAACRRRLGHGPAADEAAQATFVILARRAGEVRDPGSLGPWLYGVARRVCSSSLRNTGRRSRHELASGLPADVAGPPPPEESPWSDLRPYLDAALDSLSPQQRDAVVCHLLEGQSHVEAARNLGISEDAVRKRVDYALEKLRCWFARRGLAVASTAIAAGLAADGDAIEPALGGSCVQAALHPSGPVADLADTSGRIRPLAGCAVATALFLALAGVTSHLWLAAQADAPTAVAAVAVPPPPWLDADLSRSLAAFAQADAAQHDPLGLAHHFGTDWRTHTPRLIVDLDRDTSVPGAAIRLTGAAPVSPSSVLALLLGDSRLHVLPATSLRRLDPLAMPPRQTGEWLRLAIACDPDRFPRLADLLNDLQPYSLPSRSAPISAIPELTARIRQQSGGGPLADTWQMIGLICAMRQQPGLDQLAQAWSGDLTVVAAPGTQRPELSIVIGLRTEVDTGILTRTVSGSLGGWEPLPAPTGVSMWKTTLFDLSWTVLLSDRRIVATTASDPLALLAAETAPGPDAQLSVEADLAGLADGCARHPALMDTLGAWFPRLPGMLETVGRPGATVETATWLGIDGRHRPALPLRISPWSLTWTATADGCRARETGPHILSTCLAACATTIAGADAAALTRQLAGRIETAELWMRHRQRLAGILDSRAFLVDGASLPESAQQALRAWFPDGPPSPAQLASFRADHRRDGSPCTLVTAVHIPSATSGILLWELTGPLLWSIPVEAGWAIGIIGTPTAGPGRLPSATGSDWTVGSIPRTIGLLRSDASAATSF